MRIPATGTSRHLTYCLNIHPGESWTETLSAIRRFAPRVKAKTNVRQPFGLGLRLGAAAAHTLEADPRERERLQATLAEHGLYVFTLNGFPYGAFHGARIKESVYEPDWTTAARAEYTTRLARILAGLLPRGVPGSISTVPLGYGPRPADGSAALARTAAHLSDTLLTLDALRREQDRDICLALEPEPDCALQHTHEVEDFFDRVLPESVVPVLAARRGATPAAAEAIARRHLGVCFDTCHAAVQFEDPAAGLDRLRARDIRVAKVQLSAALTCPAGTDPRAVLDPFRDPVYLHQTRLRGPDGRIAQAPDLEAALRAHGTRRDAEWRVHFHVPLYLPGRGLPGSTVTTLSPAFFRSLGTIAHIEIETYTFDVLPAHLRHPDVTDSIAAEYAWALRHLASTEPAQSG